MGWEAVTERCSIGGIMYQYSRYQVQCSIMSEKTCENYVIENYNHIRCYLKESC